MRSSAKRRSSASSISASLTSASSVRSPTAASALVERFDTESFSDFSAKLSNFRGLVLGCMDSYDSNQILILQGFSRSTRFAILCTAQISKFQQNSQTLEGSFSSVSTPIFASKYSFFSISRDLQDLQSFAPLRSQNFSKISSNFFVFLLYFSQKSLFFNSFH